MAIASTSDLIVEALHGVLGIGLRGSRRSEQHQDHDSERATKSNEAVLADSTGRRDLGVSGPQL